MPKYTLNQTLKTLEKLFKRDITTTKQFRNLKWDNLDKIDKELTPVEKSFIMDFRNAVIKKKIVEFLAGKEIKEESEKSDRTL
ncbi:MAG: hypothetical protein HFJ55_01210 [Clostridia bacterium]|nr:hypothetical protein [Clostridia bacterium]